MRILFEAYSDQHLVNSAPKEIEELRRRAQNYGIIASIGIFSLNEVARLTMRSPMFKLYPQNFLFFAIAPTMFLRYSYNQAI